MLVHVQLRQLLLCENIIAFLDKLCQLHVHGVWRIILFTLEILNLHPIFMNAPYSNFKSWKNGSNGSNGGGSPLVTMVTNVVWEIHGIKGVGFDGSTRATTFKPLVEELVESSYEQMLG
jgi:hypothetical protein